MTSMKKVVSIALAAIMTVSLAACGGSPQSADTSDAPQSSQAAESTDQGQSADAKEFSWQMATGTTIKILFNQHPYVEPIVAALPEFEKLTGIKVEYSIIPESNYFDKVTMQLNSRSGDPDIFMTGPYQVWEYASAGYMQDLDVFLNDPSMVSDDFDVDDFYESILNAVRWDGKAGHMMGTGPLWGLPMGFETNELTYNKRIFDEHGIKPPTTLEELYEAAKALQGHSGANTYGIALRGERGWATLITGYMTLYSTWGAKDFEVKDGKLVSVVNSPEAVAMTDWYVKLVRDGGSPTWASATWYSAGGELGAGTAAMLLDSTANGFSQATAGKSQEAGNLAYVPIPIPAGKEHPASNLWVWSLAMNSASKNKEAAWLFMQYFSGKQYQNKSAVDSAIVCTPRKSTNESEGYQNIVGGVLGFNDTFATMVEYTSMLYTPQPHIFEVLTEWSATLQEIVEGKYATTQEGMDALKEKLDKIVADVVVEN